MHSDSTSEGFSSIYRETLVNNNSEGEKIHHIEQLDYLRLVWKYYHYLEDEFHCQLPPIKMGTLWQKQNEIVTELVLLICHYFGFHQETKLKCKQFMDYLLMLLQEPFISYNRLHLLTISCIYLISKVQVTSKYLVTKFFL